MFAPRDLNQFNSVDSQYACQGSWINFFFSASLIFIGAGSAFFVCMSADRTFISMSWIS